MMYQLTNTINRGPYKVYCEQNKSKLEGNIKDKSILFPKKQDYKNFGKIIVYNV